VLIEAWRRPSAERSLIFTILQHKSREREIEPTKDMISDQDLISKLRASWPTLQAELEDELSQFDSTFRIVQSFYEELPWW
jgi:hypothetical protein